MNKIMVLLVLVLMAGVGYLYYDSHQQRQHYRQETAALQLQLDALHDEVNTLGGKVKTLQESSVQGMVREANSALLDGWQSLMSTVESELRRARESFKDSTADTAPADEEPVDRSDTGNGSPDYDDD